MYITQCGKDEEWGVEIMTSVGFVVEETKNHIVLAGDLVGEELRRVIVIPRENIVK